MGTITQLETSHLHSAIATPEFDRVKILEMQQNIGRNVKPLVPFWSIKDLISIFLTCMFPWLPLLLPMYGDPCMGLDGVIIGVTGGKYRVRFVLGEEDETEIITSYSPSALRFTGSIRA